MALVAGVGAAAAHNLLPFLLHFSWVRSCLVLGGAKETLLLVRDSLLLELHYMKSYKGCSSAHWIFAWFGVQSMSDRETGIVSITSHFILFEPKIKPLQIYLNKIACLVQTLKFAFNTTATVIHDILYRMDRFWKYYLLCCCYFCKKLVALCKNLISNPERLLMSVLKKRLSHAPLCPGGHIK